MALNDLCVSMYLLTLIHSFQYCEEHGVLWSVAASSSLHYASFISKVRYNTDVIPDEITAKLVLMFTVICCLQTDVKVIIMSCVHCQGNALACGILTKKSYMRFIQTSIKWLTCWQITPELRANIIRSDSICG